MTPLTEALLQRPNGRAADALRPLQLSLGELKFAEGSAMLSLGDTRVLAAASVEARVPPFLAGSGRGWVTAEYAMLPRATQTRNAREVAKGRPSGRTSEIQRLIGRSLRAVVDTTLLGERTVTVDCDVLQADGGTRTASVTAGYVALAEALAKLVLCGDLPRLPLLEPVAAVSVGIVRGVPSLDLEYVEDQEAEVDMNVVATASGQLVEVQGTGERRGFARRELDALIDLALAGSGRGWVTAEYAMLPRATQTRNAREVAKGRPSGRTSEIQRLIGRSLRAVVDTAALGERTVTVDCDVLQADGGTRTAAITGAYVALADAVSWMAGKGMLAARPEKALYRSVAAVSVGVVAGEPMLDLCYTEDVAAEVDMNVVCTDSGEFVEVQGTGESGTFDRTALDRLLDLAVAGCGELAQRQAEALKAIP